MAVFVIVLLALRSRVSVRLKALGAGNHSNEHHNARLCISLHERDFSTHPLDFRDPFSRPSGFGQVFLILHGLYCIEKLDVCNWWMGLLHLWRENSPVFSLCLIWKRENSTANVYALVEIEFKGMNCNDSSSCQKYKKLYKCYVVMLLRI